MSPGKSEQTEPSAVAAVQDPARGQALPPPRNSEQSGHWLRTPHPTESHFILDSLPLFNLKYSSLKKNKAGGTSRFNLAWHRPAAPSWITAAAREAGAAARHLPGTRLPFSSALKAAGPRSLTPPGGGLELKPPHPQLLSPVCREPLGVGGGAGVRG